MFLFANVRSQLNANFSEIIFTLIKSWFGINAWLYQWLWVYNITIDNQIQLIILFIIHNRKYTQQNWSPNNTTL